MTEKKNQFTKVFDDWVKVDCEQCERWWLNQCDGVCKGEKRTCNSFLATRSIILPERIKRLENEIKWLKIASVALCISVISLALRTLFGG